MKVRRISKRIEVTRSGQSVPIDFRLSGDVSNCAAVQVVVVGKNLPVRSVIPCLGEFALEFEGKKVHPINFIVPYATRQADNTDQHFAPDLLPLKVDVQNRIITGFYRDAMSLGEDFTPYSIRFIFHCTAA